MWTTCIAAAFATAGVFGGLAGGQDAAKPAAEWSQWRGPTRDGVCPKGWFTPWPGTEPKVLWRAQVGAGCSSMVLSKGRLYTMGNTGSKELDAEKKSRDVVWCLDAETGREVWKHEYEAPFLLAQDAGGPNSTPFSDGKFLYTVSKLGIVHCLDAEKGSVIWQRNLVADEKQLKSLSIWGGAVASPLVVGDVVIVSVGLAHGLEKTTGKTLYEIKGANRWISPMLVETGGRTAVVIGQEKGKEQGFLGFDAAGGEKVFSMPGFKTYVCNPIFFDDKVFVSVRGCDGGTRLYPVDPQKENPDPLWQTKEGSYWGNAVRCGELVFVGEEKDFACLDLKTGEVKWSEKSLSNTQPVLSDGKVLTMRPDGKLFVIEAAAEYKVLAQAQAVPRGTKFSISPALSPGRLYLRNEKGDVACLDVSGR